MTDIIVKDKKPRRNKKKKSAKVVELVVNPNPTLSSNTHPKKKKNKKRKSLNPMLKPDRSVPAAERALLQRARSLFAPLARRDQESSTILSQLILPYDSKLVRVPAPDCSTAIPTALARNFVILRYNLSQLVDFDSLDAKYAPVAGTRDLANTYRLYPDLRVTIPITHFYDLMVLGVLPAPGAVTTAGPFTSSYVVGDDASSADMATTQSVNGVTVFASKIVGTSNITGATTSVIPPVVLQPSHLKAFSNNSPYGEVRLCTFDNVGHRVHWIDATNPQLNSPTTVDVYITLQNGCSVTPPATTVNVVMIRVFPDDNSETVVDMKGIVATTPTGNQAKVTLTIPASSYYKFRIEGLVTTPPNTPGQVAVTCVYNSSSSIVSRQVINPYITYGNYASNVSQLVGRVQVNGCGLLVSNTTQEAGRGGNIYGLANVQSTGWYEALNVNSETIGTGTRANFYEGNWKNGIYSFVKPNLSPWKRRNYIEANASGVTSPSSFILASQNTEYDCFGYNTINISPPLSNTQSSSWYTNSATLHFAVAYEYESNNQLVNVQRTNLPIEASIHAYDQLTRLPAPFSENKVHLPLWMSRIKNGVTDLLRNPNVGYLSKALMSFGDPVMSSIGTALATSSKIAEML